MHQEDVVVGPRRHGEVQIVAARPRVDETAVRSGYSAALTIGAPSDQTPCGESDSGERWPPWTCRGRPSATCRWPARSARTTRRRGRPRSASPPCSRRTGRPVAVLPVLVRRRVQHVGGRDAGQADGTEPRVGGAEHVHEVAGGDHRRDLELGDPEDVVPLGVRVLGPRRARRRPSRRCRRSSSTTWRGCCSSVRIDM